MPRSQTPYVPRKNKAAGLKQPSGCMTAAACRHDFWIQQMVALCFIPAQKRICGRPSQWFV